ncbi:F-box/FBD/LRR-repeat protein At1g13570 isoform X2 [Amborella trichopoda]|uniref:F-box/FBD/LRR-repeat protein At1g13570 isoform X2 n=1 Tax=Amborella trichopoda TaxID=13333 RepID=UPI0009BDAD65|nr:F-box/FBD/LRR-repeat protein At1g13570 isoform X2 [Amborella trichopoda]|eukprot:XP_020522537.1 F-box/FBD/LRR-repeat protein At1g13570 isoform X2 [Amborella trichopoda]
MPPTHGRWFQENIWDRYMGGLSGRALSLENMDRKISEDGNTTQIDDLPDGILSHIVTFLSIQEAVKTSVLSSRWKQVWTATENLFFCEYELCGKQRGYKQRKRMVGIIDHVLKFHINRVERFLLDFDPRGFESHVDEWVSFLTKSGVQEISINFRREVEGVYLGGHDYELPSRFFDCISLRLLMLKNCIMNVPLDFKGFNSLRTLFLSDVYINGDQLSTLVSKCKVLQGLALLYCRDTESFRMSGPHSQLKNVMICCCLMSLGDIEIDAPSLLHFCFMGCIFGSPVLSVPRLLDATIISCIEKRPPTIQENPFHKVARSLSKLAHVESLTLAGYFVKTLADAEVWNALPTSFPNIKELDVGVNLTKSSETRIIYHFLESCNNLEKIVLSLNQDDKELLASQYWDLRKPTYCMANHLKTVTVTNLEGLVGEIRFVTFLLRHTRKLENITLSFYENLRSTVRAKTAMDVLTNVKKVSTDAEMCIKFEDVDADD